jgi:hypothetical protein
MGRYSLQGSVIPLYAVIMRIHLGEVCEPCADDWIHLYMSSGVSRDFIEYDVVDPPDCDECEGELQDD